MQIISKYNMMISGTSGVSFAHCGCSGASGGVYQPAANTTLHDSSSTERRTDGV